MGTLQGRTALVTVASRSSEAGRRGRRDEAVSCAAKFAQVGMARAWNHELRG